jgi:putative nucleotidyltransferase with HDIG domain
MKHELAHFKNPKEFCPVSFKKYGPQFWSLFAFAALAAVVLNLLFDSQLLLGLYAYPIIFLAMVQITFPVYIVLSAALLSTVFLFASPEPILIAVLISFAGLMLLSKRVIFISNRNFNGKSEQEEMLLNTVLSLAKTIDARDQYTAFHSHNVADYARSIAKELGLNHEEVESTYLAGLIHDIGKIATPDHILQKEGRLTEEEYGIMKKHSEDGYQIIKGMKRFEEIGISAIVRHHHERFDGKGYPQGLKGTEIPLGARILGVADAFDAMTTNRSYRQKLAIETAAEELQRFSGSQFDPAAAKAFLKVLKREGKLQMQEEVVFGAAQLA